MHESADLACAPLCRASELKQAQVASTTSDVLMTMSCCTYRPATVTSLCIAAALTIVMWRRYQKTQKVMPAGFTAALSFAMVGFYLWNILLFKPPVKLNK